MILRKTASKGPFVATAFVAFTRTAHGAEVATLGDETLSVDVTNTAIVDYRFNNRNSDDRPNSSPDAASTIVDDDYAEWLDRLNVEARYYRFRLNFRLDAATYFDTKTRDNAREIATAELPKATGTEVNDYANGVIRELHSRYLNTYYLSKISAGYAQPGLDATIGDFYAQLGRGLVFSVRKIDELAQDTTVRGGKLAVQQKLGSLQIGFTGFAGQMNPLRIDETTGRRLHSENSPLFFGFPETGDIQLNEFSSTGQPIKVKYPAQVNYLEDTVFGGHVEGGTRDVILGLNASLLERKSYAREYLECLQAERTDCSSLYPTFSTTNPSLLHNSIRTFSGSVSIPSIAKQGDVYLEVAGQQLRDGRVEALASASLPERTASDLSGYAVYASVNGQNGPLALSLEGKHYRKFFPLSGNVDAGPAPGFSAPEFQTVAYNQVPTVEPIYVEPFGAVNVCNTGGRLRSDYRFSGERAVYAWVGRYVSYSEKDALNTECDTAPKFQTNTWDTAVGVDLDFERNRSHAKAWVGTRLTDLEENEDPSESDVYYREAYIRYDLVKHLGGPFSLQAQGFHRRRYEPVKLPEPWHEGENYTALQWSPHFSAIFGYEYLGTPGCDAGSDRELCHYFNGGLQWRSASQKTALHQLFDTVSVFVGQRRGAVRCVSGVCRQFPPFEGARLELVSRF